MIEPSQTNFDCDKARQHEMKGDELFAKGKFRDALEEYKKSEQLHPRRPEIYEKLLSSLDQATGWNEEDFSNSMAWTMQKQELEHPEIKLVHETFSPEYQEVQSLIQKLMTALDENTERLFVEKILNYGVKANLALLHFILSLKTILQEKPPDDQTPGPVDSFIR